MALTNTPAWEVEYDAEGDVLYASRGAPQPAASVEVGDDIFLRYVPGNPEVVGITIVNFLQHYPPPAGRSLRDHATAEVAALWQAYPKVPPTALKGTEPPPGGDHP
jgi:uncharacterized protein YuzE